MKKFEISIIKNEDEGTNELFWLPVDDNLLVNILLGITNALIEELDDRHE